MENLESRKSSGILNIQQSEINQNLKYLNDKLMEFINANIDKDIWEQFDHQEVVMKLDKIDIEDRFVDYEISQLRQEYKAFFSSGKTDFHRR